MQEISGLRSHDSSADAMKAFCRQSLSQRVMYGCLQGAPDTLYSFYIFSAPSFQKYGANFASFIKEHKLGKVWGSRTIMNRAFHDGRSNKVWIWTPDTKALRSWWDANKVVRE